MVNWDYVKKGVIAYCAVASIKWGVILGGAYLIPKCNQLIDNFLPQQQIEQINCNAPCVEFEYENLRNFLPTEFAEINEYLMTNCNYCFSCENIE